MSLSDYKQQLSADAERIIDDHIKYITISPDGCKKAAMAVIRAFEGVRILPIERCDVLREQAIAVSRNRIKQIEGEGQ